MRDLKEIERRLIEVAKAEEAEQKAESRSELETLLDGIINNANDSALKAALRRVSGFELDAWADFPCPLYPN